MRVKAGTEQFSVCHPSAAAIGVVGEEAKTSEEMRHLV